MELMHIEQSQTGHGASPRTSTIIISVDNHHQEQLLTLYIETYLR